MDGLIIGCPGCQDSYCRASVHLLYWTVRYEEKYILLLAVSDKFKSNSKTYSIQYININIIKHSTVIQKWPSNSRL